MPDADHSPDSARLLVTNQPGEVDRAQDQIVAAAERHHYPKASIFALRLSLQEAVSNAFRHGHKALPPTTPVTIDYDVGDSRIRVAVQDQGPGFDPSSVPDPTLETNLEIPSGRGLFLMKAYMESLTYNPSGNRLEMVYRHPGNEGG